MIVSAVTRNAVLRESLFELIRRDAEGPKRVDLDAQLGIRTTLEVPASRHSPVDVVISVGEINDEHGTGPLVKRVFKNRRGIFSIRSRDDWGIHNFGDWHVKLSPKRQGRADFYSEILRALAGKRVKTVTCVPFSVSEILASIAIKEAFDAKLCIWVMDDQNIASNNIPDMVMQECLNKCALRLFTHPELRSVYEQKYRLRGYILPAVVPAHLVAEQPLVSMYDASERTAALLGSFWDQSWFDRLCSILNCCKYTIHWYGQNRSPWLKFPAEDLARAGIVPFGIIPEDRLAVELRKYPFVIVPVGALDKHETNKGVASLSLPGRILFTAATSHTPVLVVGSARTCGARFVEHFGIGVVAPYEVASVRAAMDRLIEPEVQRVARSSAATLAPMFSDRGVVDWLAASIEIGAPADDRFENAFSGYPVAAGELLTRGRV
jgi:hypothetical protein